MSEERQAFNENSPWWGEHVFRYLAVKDHIQPDDSVLDLACGTGYGSQILASFTNGSVIGGDICEKTIKQNQTSHRRQNLSFQILDGTKLPFPSEHFDKIVSFETIEHTTEFDTILREFARLLKPRGILFLSTPNRLVNSSAGKANPFHTQEWDSRELEIVLRAHFDSVYIYGQVFTRHNNSASLMSTIKRTIEKIMYARGVRKAPLKWKNRLSQLLFQRNHYPEPDEFSLAEDSSQINRSSTLFSICKKISR